MRILSIVFGAALTMALASACAQPVENGQCVSDTACVADNPTLKCCTAGKVVRKNPSKCPVAAGLVGGMSASCQDPEASCVADNTCVAANYSLKCCTAGKTITVDATACPAPSGGAVGGNTAMCK